MILWRMPLAMTSQLVAQAHAKAGTKIHRPLKYGEALAKLKKHAESRNQNPG
jgi:hypothetical protein